MAAILFAEVTSIAFGARLVESCKRIDAFCGKRYHGDPVSARALRSWSGTKAASCGSGSDNKILLTVVAGVAFVLFGTHALGFSHRSMRATDLRGWRKSNSANGGLEMNKWECVATL